MLPSLSLLLSVKVQVNAAQEDPKLTTGGALEGPWGVPLLPPQAARRTPPMVQPTHLLFRIRNSCACQHACTGQTLSAGPRVWFSYGTAMDVDSCSLKLGPRRLARRKRHHSPRRCPSAGAS